MLWRSAISLSRQSVSLPPASVPPPNVGVPYSVTHVPLIGHLSLSGVWFGVAPRMGIQRHVFWNACTTCSKFDTLSRLYSQHDWGTCMYGRSMSTKIFTLITNDIP
jgi:hypothetical protein